VGEEAVVKASAEEAEVAVEEKGEEGEGASKVGEEASAARKAEEEAAIAMKAEGATRAARVDPGGMAANRAKAAGAMVKQTRNAALTEAAMETKTEKTKVATETKAGKKEEATKVEEASAAKRKTMGGRALMCADREGARANQDDVRQQMLDAGSTPRLSFAGLELELGAGAKMPGRAVKAGHGPTPSDQAGRGCAQFGVGPDFPFGLDPVDSDMRTTVPMHSRLTAGPGAVSKQAGKQKVNAGSSLTSPGPALEQESEVKAQEPKTERPTDQVKVRRSLNAAREALVTEERAQQKTLAKLRVGKDKITAAEVQLKEEKEKSARRELELERGIERLQAEKAQLDKESALVCCAGSTAMVCTIPGASGKGDGP